MTLPSKKKLAIALVIAISVLFNIYIFGVKFLDNVRVEGYGIAVLSIMETAKIDKQVVLKYEDKEGNVQKVLLKLSEETPVEVPKQ
jgi:hypothetical protein